MKKLYILGILIAIIWLMIRFPYAMSNPGDLSAGHTDINKKCESCHHYFGGIPNSKCIACHKLAGIGKDTADPQKILFHEGLGAHSCLSCHTDHKGVNPAMATGQFNHSVITSSLLNTCTSCHKQPGDSLHNHLTAACGNCHNTNNWKSGASFDHNMIEPSIRNECQSCHKPPVDNYHQSITNNCQKCHTTGKWVPSTFEHSAYFRLDKDHNVSCNTCHTNNVLTSYTCYGCHEHTESRMLEKHNEEGIYTITKCASCHKSADEHDIRGRENNGRNKDESKKKEDDDDD
ncbi:MAG: class III cytochrome C family protein [Sphingobacteriales bacterium]|nr:class III cytochrome C family protein [Sphingobacteriales bacterium]